MNSVGLIIRSVASSKCNDDGSEINLSSETCEIITYTKRGGAIYTIRIIRN